MIFLTSAVFIALGLIQFAVRVLCTVALLFGVGFWSLCQIYFLSLSGWRSPLPLAFSSLCSTSMFSFCPLWSIYFGRFVEGDLLSLAGLLSLLLCSCCPPRSFLCSVVVLSRTDYAVFISVMLLRCAVFLSVWFQSF